MTTSVNGIKDVNVVNGDIISKQMDNATENATERLLEVEILTKEDLAPDGGWGWMVALGMILAFTTSNGPTASFAIIFGDFLNETGQAGSASTLLNSVFMVSFSFSGLLTNCLLKKFSMRSVGIAGAIIFAIPNIALALVQHVYQMALIFLLQGIGLGFIITICNTNFNAYFVKRRATVMSASQVIIGLGGIVYPICIERMMTAFGFRGTAAMTGVLSLHCVVGMTMMHPVEWHFRDRREVLRERAAARKLSKGELDGSRRYDEVGRRSIDISQANSRRTSLRSLKEGRIQEIPLLVETLKTSQSRVTSSSDLDIGGPFRPRTKSITARDVLKKRLSILSASSMTNLTSVGVLGQPEVRRQSEMENKFDSSSAKKSRTILTTLADFFEVGLLKDWVFLNSCLGISFVFTSDLTFATLLPLMMTDAGYSKSDSALAITVGATAELLSRILLAIFTVFVNARAKYIFFFAMVAMVFAKLAFLYLEDTLSGTLVSIAAIGVVRSWLLVPHPLVIVENFTVDNFAAAYGVFTVVSGVTSIVFGPVVGYIKDWTNSFDVCQLVLVGLNFLFVVPWMLEFFWVDFLPRRKDKDAKQAPGA
ncbi:uncharacterized protein LOC105699395 isoform X2 [Orussus abietinus]|uniref:uncharacterized protein LOC105699395 isoform X2 n=1 Tax=Orussus abietinus TaxID=222816 RepID=UPI000626BC8C|nr:uncharacterized protein LOC105699395 isoform X2 [Orussus abietinus]